MKEMLKLITGLFVDIVIFGLIALFFNYLINHKVEKINIRMECMKNDIRRLEDGGARGTDRAFLFNPRSTGKAGRR